MLKRKVEEQAVIERGLKDNRLRSVEDSRFRSIQLYGWLALGVVSLGWGFATALKPGHSQDLTIVNTWLRTWLWQGSSPYHLPEIVVGNYPPHAMVALSPLALVPESYVAALWAALNLLMAPLVGYLAYRALGREATARAALLPVAMFLAWAGLRTGIANGQFTLLILGFGLLAFLCEEKRTWLGGFFLALALMKPHIGGAVLLWALFTKRWRMVAVACGWMALGLALFSLRLGESPVESVRAYLGVIQHQFGRGADAQGSMALRVVELRPLVALFVHQEAWASRIQQLLLVLLLGCTLLVALMKSRLSRSERDGAILQLCCLWLLMSVFHNPYDTILLLPVLAGLWAASVPHPMRSKQWMDSALVWVLQLAMVVELPAVWWKLSKTINLAAYGWAGVILSNFDRLLVLGLFVYLLNRARLYRAARHAPAESIGEMIAQPSTPNP